MATPNRARNRIRDRCRPPPKPLATTAVPASLSLKSVEYRRGCFQVIPLDRQRRRIRIAVWGRECGSTGDAIDLVERKLASGKRVHLKFIHGRLLDFCGHAKREAGGQKFDEGRPQWL